MKPMKILLALVLIALATIPFVFADAITNIALNADYGEKDISSAMAGGDAVDSFELSSTRDEIQILATAGNIDTSSIIFTSETGYSGMYYGDGTRIRSYTTGTEMRVRVNSINYRLKHMDASSSTLEPLDLGIGAYVLASETGNTITLGEDTMSNLLIFPDDGSNLIVKSGRDYYESDLPAVIVFNNRAVGDLAGGLTETERGESETRAAESAGVTGTAPEREAGCHDQDEGDDELTTSSYVSLVSVSGDALVVADYCAGDDNVFVYEAFCAADGSARVQPYECPADRPCSRGACRGTGALTRFCVDSDRQETGETAKAALERATQTKSTTVGFYAAVEGGKEFGAWNDYCKNGKSLVEYYCSADTEAVGLYREITCPNGCSDGKCAELPICYDTDGGNYPNVVGTIKGIDIDNNGYSYTDECEDENTLFEYSCTPDRAVDGIARAEITCGDGTVCSGGRCLNPALISGCNECDELLNPFNIKVGTRCNADNTPSAWELKSCPSGTYCSEAEQKCVIEPLNARSQVNSALQRREQWALLVDEVSMWAEDMTTVRPIGLLSGLGEECEAAEDCASGICTYETLSFWESLRGVKPGKNCVDVCTGNEDCRSGEQCVEGSCEVPIVDTTEPIPAIDFSDDIRDVTLEFRGIRELRGGILTIDA